MLGSDEELRQLQALVGARFPVYQTAVRDQTVAFYVTVNLATLEEDFEATRVPIMERGYIPFLTKEGGEHILYVQRRAPQRYWGSTVNLALLILTILTTVFAGALNWAAYDGKDSLDLDATLKGALFFSFPLLLMLGIHEMGHYIVAKRYKVHASLPFFIPSVPPLGTFGAMISMRDPIPTRRALLDIGAAGPLLGFAVAIPVTLVGLTLTNADPRPAPANSGGASAIMLPILFEFLRYFVPLPDNVVVHPTVFAGWVGIFVTAMNLLPAGQLDGGHVARALLGEKARYASYAAVGLMFLLAIFGGFMGWAIIALFIVLLGLRHPPPLNDLVPLDAKRVLVGMVTTLVLVTSFVPIPITEIPAEPGMEFRTPGAAGNATAEVSVVVPANATANVSFAFVNTGNVELRAKLITLRGIDWSADVVSALWQGNASHPVSWTGDGFVLNTTEHVLATLQITVPEGTLPQTNVTFWVRADVRIPVTAQTVEKSLVVRVSVP